MFGLLGGALQVGGAIANGIFGARQARKQQRMLEEQRAKNERWFNRRYNEVGTERADARAALTAMRDAQQARIANQAGRSAVMGGSASAMAAEKQAANQAIGNTIANINANNESRKDSIEKQYMANDSAITDKMINNERQKQNAIAGAVTGASKAAAGMFGLLDNNEKNNG